MRDVKIIMRMSSRLDFSASLLQSSSSANIDEEFIEKFSIDESMLARVAA